MFDDKKGKDVDEMSESELKRELKELYKELNDLSQDELEDIRFDAKMKLKKRNEDGKVVDTREVSI